MIGIPALRNALTSKSESFQKELLELEHSDLDANQLMQAILRLVVLFYTPPTSIGYTSSPFLDLPFELSLVIFFKLDLRDLLTMFRVCKHLNAMASNFAETLYRNLLIRDYNIRKKTHQQTFFQTYRLSHNIAHKQYSFTALEGSREMPVSKFGSCERIFASWSVDPNQSVYTFPFLIPP
jgi:hypothetical protein